jgi:hypothetical protein
MKRNVICRMLVSLSLAAVLVALLPAAHGQSCSLARAAAQYGFSDNGTVIGVGPRAAVGTITLDVAGNASGRATSSLNGSTSAETFSGMYTVDPDCTGTLTADIFDQSGNKIFTVTLNLAWDDNMREIRLIFTSVVLPDGRSLATVINGNARKLLTVTGQ